MYCHTAGCAGMLTPFRICCSSHSRSWSLVSLRCSEYNKQHTESLYNWKIIYSCIKAHQENDKERKPEKRIETIPQDFIHTLTHVNRTQQCKQYLAMTNRQNKPFSGRAIQQYYFHNSNKHNYKGI